MNWFSIWFSGVSQSVGQWKSSSSRGIPKSLTIFATLGHGEMSGVFGGNFVKITPLSLGALEFILSGLLSGTSLDD